MRHARLIVASLAAAAIVVPLAVMWQTSLLPASYRVTDMGYPDTGTASAHHGHDTHSVPELSADPARPADVSLTFTARKGPFVLPSGRRFDGYTLNGQSPGPLVHATVGQLVEVVLVNESVPDGITLHWHGINVPNASDGVAGVTQDAIGLGHRHVYRFVAKEAGTYWYHSHQLSHKQVAGGLLGPVVISPADPGTIALVHLYGGIRTVNGFEGDVQVTAAPGADARLRIINTDNGLLSAWVNGASFRLFAVDGTDINAPPPVSGVAVAIPAGGRADLSIAMPADGAPVRVQLGGSVSLLLGTSSFAVPTIPRPSSTLDLLSYGQPLASGFSRFDRTFRYDIGRRPGFINGRPGLFWTVNGHLFPNIPMFMVAEGDTVRMTITNHSGEAHPMHLHGHHALVLTRNGIPSTGSPWWTDSLEVGNGESYEIAFVANNPGIWMDHCHNLPHAFQGLTAHLMYEGVTTPYEIRGRTHNTPE